MSPDVLNAGFELVGAFFTWQNFKRIRRDKGYAGIYWPAVVFFTSWGLWNLFYYPHLGQWWSATAGLALFVCNCCWLGGMWYYGPIDRRERGDVPS